MPGYAREKFWQAIHVLATSDDTIQARLAVAARHLMNLKPNDLPGELREEFAAVWRELHKQEPAGDESAIEATMRQLTAEQSRELAERILGIHTELHGGI